MCALLLLPQVEAARAAEFEEVVVDVEEVTAALADDPEVWGPLGGGGQGACVVSVVAVGLAGEGLVAVPGGRQGQMCMGGRRPPAPCTVRLALVMPLPSPHPPTPLCTAPILPPQEVLINVAPKKANWDLRRDIAPRLAKLERRTQVGGWVGVSPGGSG